MFVACNLPAGYTIRHNGEEIRLSGAHTGLNPNTLVNGKPQDDQFRVSGYGITELQGTQADAFKDWAAIAGKGEGPIQSNAIVFADKREDVAKEARRQEGLATGFAGLTDKDLPEGVEAAPADAKQ